MSETMEELIKSSTQELDEKIRNPLILQKVAERGIKLETEEDIQNVLDIANDIGLKIASGELAAIPKSALEEDGTLSKHASDAAGNDFLAFAPDIGFKVEDQEIAPSIKIAAAVLALQG